MNLGSSTRVAVIALFWAMIVGGCSKPYEALFVVAVQERPDPHEIRYIYHPPEMQAHLRVLESDALWQKYAEPQLKALNISTAKARSGFSVSSGRSAVVDRELTFEFRVRLETGGEQLFTRIRDGYIAELVETNRRATDDALRMMIAQAEAESHPGLRAALDARITELRGDHYRPRLLSTQKL